MLSASQYPSMQAKHCKATLVFKMEATIKLHVSLPSGRSEVVAVGLSATVLDLKRAAQESFGQCFLRLAAANGDLLVQKDSLQTCGLQNEQCLSALVLQPRITSTSSAVALWCVGGECVVTWGEKQSGADSSEFQDELRNVRQICGIAHAFAALLEDASVVTWGNHMLLYGGRPCEVPDEVQNVNSLFASQDAFAALLNDGYVVTWGSPTDGGDSSGVQSQLKNVKNICGAGHAFAATLADGSVVSWGSPAYGSRQQL